MKSVFGLLFSLVMMISIQADWKDQINLDEAHNIFTGSINIKTAIIDNGVYPHHLFNNRLEFYGNYNDNGDIVDWCYDIPQFTHGTKMTGIIAQVDKYCVLKSYRSTKSYNDEVAIGLDAINTTLTNILSSDQDILNCSFSGVINDHNLKWDIAKKIINNFKINKIIIAGTGNSNESNIGFPSIIDEVIAVGTIDEYNNRWYETLNQGSSYGLNIDFVAPGGLSQVLTTSLEFDHLEEEIHIDPESGQSWIVTSYYFNPIMDYTGGTSSATAIVSGIASLIKGYYLDNYNIELSNLEIMNILKYSASDLNTPGYDIETGWGCPNAHKALEVLNDNVIRIVQHIPNPSSGSQMNYTMQDYGDRDITIYGISDYNPNITDGLIPGVSTIKRIDTWNYNDYFGIEPKIVTFLQNDLSGFRYDYTSEILTPQYPKNIEVSPYNYNLETWFYKINDEWYPIHPNLMEYEISIFIDKVVPQNINLYANYDPINNLLDATEPGNKVNLLVSLNYGTMKSLHYTYQRMYDEGSVFHDFYDSYSNYYSFDKTLQNDGEYYRVKIDDNGLTTNGIYTNTYFLKPPVRTDPIVQYSDRNDATGYANSRKIVVDSLENIYVVYTKNDSVFCTKSSDNGESWQTNDFIGLGDKPAINLLSNSTPVICWAQDNRIYKTKRSNINWDNKETIYTAPSGTIEFLCFETDAFDQSYLGWVENGASGSSVKISEYNPNSTGATLAPTPIDDGQQNAFKCPSISFKPDGEISVTWSRNGSVYYYDLNGIEQINDIGSIGEHPIVSAYGDKISVIWKDETVDGKQRIIKRVKRNDEWEETQIIRENDDKELNYPYVVNGSQYLYCEENTDGDKDVIHLGEFSGGWLTEYQNISYNSGGNSYHPSAYYKQNWPKGKLYILWTEEMEEDIPTDAVSTVNPVKIYVKDDIEPIEYLYCDCGTPEGDYYNIQKQDTIFYDNLPEHTIDYDNNRLAYKFSSINPGRRYKIRFKFYQNSGNTIMQKISIDGRTNKVKKVFTDQITELYEWLPASCIKDGEILIDISKMAGPYAVCSEISLFEFEKNVDDEEQEDTKQQQIKHYTSNLTVSGNMLSFSNEYSTKYTVDVFNTLGQKVISLPEQIYTAGYHEINSDKGNKLSNGIYFIQISNETEVNSLKMTILR